MARGRKQVLHEESEETKQTILRTAQQLFMEYGYRAVSTRQLADACGLTQPALYHYFADKQELYVAMMQDELIRLRAALERIAERNESVHQRLKRVVTYLQNTSQHDLTLMLHDVNYELSPTHKRTLYEAFEAGMISPIASIFADGQRTGLLRDQEHAGLDPRAAVYLLLNMISRFTGRRDEDVAAHPFQYGNQSEAAERIVHILLYGLTYPQKVGGQEHDVEA